MRWAGHVAYMEMRCAYRILVGKHEVRCQLEDPGIDRRIFKQQVEGGTWTGLIWPRRGKWWTTVNMVTKPLGSTDCGKFLD